MSPSGIPGQVVDRILHGNLIAVVDDRIVREYREVLMREKLSIDPVQALALLEFFEADADRPTGDVLPMHLPDPDDQMFLEAAMAAEADCIVTGNKRHFPAGLCRPVAVLTPRGLINMYARS